MEYKITGDFYDVLEVSLLPGDTFNAEQGHVIYMEDGIKAESRFGSSEKGSKIGRFFKGSLKSLSAGESMIFLKFTNTTNMAKKLVLSSEHGTIIPLEIGKESLFCGRGCYIASSEQLDLSFNIKSFIGEKIYGSGIVFLDSYGKPIVKELGKDDKIGIGDKYLVAAIGFNEDQIDSSHVQGYALLEAEDMTRLTGPGKVYLSPMPIRRDQSNKE